MRDYVVTILYAAGLFTVFSSQTTIIPSGTVLISETTTTTVATTVVGVPSTEAPATSTSTASAIAASATTIQSTTAPTAVLQTATTPVALSTTAGAATVGVPSTEVPATSAAPATAASAITIQSSAALQITTTKSSNDSNASTTVPESLVSCYKCTGYDCSAELPGKINETSSCKGPYCWSYVENAGPETAARGCGQDESDQRATKSFTESSCAEPSLEQFTGTACGSCCGGNFCNSKILGEEPCSKAALTCLSTNLIFAMATILKILF